MDTATADLIAQYVDFMASKNKSATIRRRFNSLGTIFRLSKNPDPTKEPEVVLALKRMHRKIGRHQEQATPLTRCINFLISDLRFSISTKNRLCDLPVTIDSSILHLPSFTRMFMFSLILCSIFFMFKTLCNQVFVNHSQKVSSQVAVV